MYPGKTTRLFVTAFLLTLATACSGAGVKTGTRSASSLADPYFLLKTGLAQYSAGDFASGIRSFDRLLEAAARTDSQLTFLGVYYGVRLRLAAGLASSADSLYAEFEGVVPSAQHKEIEFLLGRAARAQEGLSGGSDNARPVASKLGVILPLSGQYQEFGGAVLEGIRLAVQKHNHNKSAQDSVSLEIRDDSSDPIRAAALGRQLAMDSSVAALIGSYENETSLSIGLVAAAIGVPLVCPTADAPGLDNLGPLVHVLNRTDPLLGRDLAQFAVTELRLHQFAVLATDDERGRALAVNFVRAVREAGGVVDSYQSYSSQTSTFKNQMSILQRYLPDAVYLPARVNEITQLASQINYYGLGHTRLLGTEQWDSERVIRLGGQYVNGALFAAPFFQDGEGLRWYEFKQLYETAYRRPVNRYSAFGYDAVSLVLSAAGSFPTDRNRLNRNLNRTLDYPGAMGIYSIEPDGLVKKKAFILEISGGKIVPAQPYVQPAPAPEAAPDSTPGEAVPK